MDDRDVATMSGEELLSASDVLQEAIAELEARRYEVLYRMDEMKYPAEIGAHDTARLLEKRYRLDPAEARRLVRLAVALPKYPAVAAALPAPGNVIAEGGVVLHSGQAEAIVFALEKIPKSANVPVEELDAAAEQMVQAARHMHPGELRKMGEQVRNILDTDGPEPREDAARAREEVWVKKAEDGVKFGGYLAAENAEKLQTVLQAGAKPHKTPDGEVDPRSRGKRQADALVDCLDIALKSGSLPTRGGIKPHIAVTINLNDLLEAGRQATGDLTYGDGLSASAIRRLACDAGIIPIVLGSDSRLLDVGREFRFVTDGLRNALNRRDKGCVICHAPPIYCDAHHVVSWFEGGVTSLANLVLLCRVDHNSLHDGHWTITIVDNKVQVTRPSWADPPPRNTGRRLPTPSATPATAPATTATTPWPPPSTDTPSATTDAEPWPPPTGTGVVPAADGDPWSVPTTTDGTPSTADLAASAQPSGGEAAGVSADTSSAAGHGWRWPYRDDIGWITTDETAAIDPWGDNPTSTATPPTTSDPATPPGMSDPATPPGTFGSATTPGGAYTNRAPWTTSEEGAALDPWGDNPTSTATPPTTSDPATPLGTSDPATPPGAFGSATTPGGAYTNRAPWTTPEEGAALDPWGDHSTDAVALAAKPESATMPVQGRPFASDAPRTTPEVAATFDPWADTA